MAEDKDNSTPNKKIQYENIQKMQQMDELHKEAFKARMQFGKELAAMPKMRPIKLILLVGWSLAMSALDNTIVNIANPNIQKDPNFVPEGKLIPQSQIQFINDLYSLAFAAFAIPASKIGDRFGITLVHRCGVLGFMVFSLMCGVSRYIKYQDCPWPYGGFYVLVVSRFFQGIFAAFLMANSMSLCSICVEQQFIGRSMAMNNLAFAAATALGPPIVGLLTDTIGWEYCFFINLFIGTISVALCWWKLPVVPKFREPKMDLYGGLIVLVGLITLILGLTFLPPEKETWIYGLFLCLFGVAVLVSFVFWELHHPFALLPKSLLTNKKIIYSLIAGLFNFALIVTVTFQQPFALQSIHGYAPSTVGLIALVNPVVQIFAAIVGSKIQQKVTSYAIKVFTSVMCAIFIIVLGFVISLDLWWIVIDNCFFAFFLGIFFVNNNSFMMQIATPDIRGMMGGCIQAFRETGFAIGIAIVNVVHEIYLGIFWGYEEVPIGQPGFEEYSQVYYHAFCVTDIVMAVISIIGMVFAMLSGVSSFEENYKCYPNKLKKQDSVIEDGAGLIENEEVQQKKEEVNEQV